MFQRKFRANPRITEKLLGLLLFLATISSEEIARAAALPPETAGLHPAPYDISVNGVNQNLILIFGEDKAHKLYASADDLEDFHFDLNKYHGQVMHFQEQNYYALAGFSGVQYTINEQSMLVKLTAPPATFKESNLNLRETRLAPSISTGGYLNYNVNSTSSFDTDPTTNNLYLSANGFGSYGQGYYNTLIQNSDGQTTMTRLLTTWQKTDPEKMSNLVLGDAFSSVSQWSQSVGFGGIQYASNFATQPNFVTSPLPNSTGVATLPSTVQVFINDTLSNTQSVNPGPFQINNIPVINGDGTVTVVTTNILGEQSIETIPYSTSSSLLKPGLSSFSYEGGFLRENFSIQSNDYTNPMLSGSYNRGILNNLTLQTHLEGTSSVQAGGLGANLLVSKIGLLNGSIAASSNSSQELGGLGLIGYTNNRNTYSYGTNLQVTSPSFTDISYSGGGTLAPPSIQSQTFLAFSLPKKNGSVSTSYTLQQNRTTSNQSLINISYSNLFAKSWFFTLSASRNMTGTSNSLYSFSLNKLLGGNTTMSANGSTNSEGHQENLSIGSQLTDQPGFAYNAQVANNTVSDSGSTQAYQGIVYAQNSYGTMSLGAGRNNNQNVYQIQGSGAIVYADHNFIPSRQINSSFALVETGTPDIKVMSNHRYYGKTNSTGNLIIPSLIPYFDNPIEIDATDLPYTSTIQDTEIIVSPYAGAGVIAHFDVGSLSGGILNLHLPNGHAVPEGAVTTDQGGEIWPVAEDGMLYISGLSIGENHLTVEYGLDACEVKFDFSKEMLPNSEDPVPNLGNVVCTPTAEPARAVGEETELVENAEPLIPSTNNSSESDKTSSTKPIQNGKTDNTAPVKNQ